MIITVGLDLGTDKCCITYQDNIGRPFIITDEKDYKISSIIGIMNNGLLIGNEINKDYIYDIPIITNLKRLIGHNSTSSDAINIANYNGWTLSDDINNNLLITIDEKIYSLNDLMCALLNKIKQIIISNIGENFNVIITIPANFNEGQKNLILSYCNQVNISCKRLIYEPCSAALTYINYFNNNLNITDSDSDENILKRILVFDFGAGTLDLAIVSCNCLIEEDQMEWMAKIESNIGDNNLGGIDIDIALKNYLLEKYPELKNINESIKFIIEKIKIKLSKLYTHNNNSLLTSLVEKYYDHIIIINIDEYFSILNNLFKDRILKLLNDIHSMSILKSEIDTILLIGGSCYNPWVQQLIKEYYNKECETYKLNLSNHLETFNLDIKDIGVSLGATCIDKKTNINGNNLIITETLPLSIGIDTINNIMCKIIPKNTLIPCTAKKYFTTSEDNQTSLSINLYQGERDDIRDNFFLGKFVIDNLDPEPQGKIVIIITISITTDGLITIEGKVRNTEKHNKKIIINRYELLINNELIESNIKQFEINDIVFNNIMLKYYELITMLNRLQYNLLDNVACSLDKEYIDNIMTVFWNDLIILYKLMNQSEKIKSNIDQLTKFINYVSNKLEYDINKYSIDYIDDKIIGIKIDNLNKLINKKLQNIVSTYQIKIDNAENINYDTINDIKLDQINSITNSTEILSSSEKELLYQMENGSEIKSNMTYLKEIKDLIIMMVDNIDSFEMPDSNKLLLLDICDKYEEYIELIIKNSSFNGLYHLELIQNICLKISNLDDIEKLQNELSSIDINELNLFSEFLSTI